MVKLRYMKKFAKILASLGVIATIFLATPVQQVYAEGVITEPRGEAATKCEKSFFGLRPWYQGLTFYGTEGCAIGTPQEDGLAAFIWTIVLNVLVDMFSIVGLLAVMYLIMGGYWYLRSGGDPVLLTRAKKTIQTALIGTVIALLATLITNLIVTILINS